MALTTAQAVALGRSLRTASEREQAELGIAPSLSDRADLRALRDLLSRFVTNSQVRGASVSDRAILDDFHTAFVSPKSSAQDIADSRIWAAEDRIAQHAVAFLTLTDTKIWRG